MQCKDEIIVDFRRRILCVPKLIIVIITPILSGWKKPPEPEMSILLNIEIDIQLSQSRVACSLRLERLKTLVLIFTSYLPRIAAWKVRSDSPLSFLLKEKQKEYLLGLHHCMHTIQVDKVCWPWTVHLLIGHLYLSGIWMRRVVKHKHPKI